MDSCELMKRIIHFPMQSIKNGYLVIRIRNESIKSSQDPIRHTLLRALPSPVPTRPQTNPSIDQSDFRRRRSIRGSRRKRPPPVRKLHRSQTRRTPPSPLRFRRNHARGLRLRALQRRPVRPPRPAARALAAVPSGSLGIHPRRHAQ